MSTTPRKALAALLVLAIDVAFRVLLLPVVWLLAATVGKRVSKQQESDA